MRIHIRECDKHHGTSVYEAIVPLLRERGFAGATVLRGVMGFGASAGIHTAKVLPQRAKVVIYRGDQAREPKT
jgi:PII-like signaling protein